MREKERKEEKEDNFFKKTKIKDDNELTVRKCTCF